MWSPGLTGFERGREGGRRKGRRGRRAGGKLHGVREKGEGWKEEAEEGGLGIGEEGRRCQRD